MVETAQRKIFIRLNAGHMAGMGHLFRMMELAEELERDDYDIEFLIKKDGVAENIISEKKFRFTPFNHDVNEDEIIRLVFNRGNAIDLWIYDILDTEEDWIRLLKEREVLVLCMDDRKGGMRCADIIVNPITGCMESLTGFYEDKRLYVGPEYSILNRKTKKYRKERKVAVRSKGFDIGVSMGGSDTYGSTVLIAEALKSFSYSGTVHFFLGPSYIFEKELNRVLKDVEYSYNVGRFVDDLHKELDKMDVVICGGGVTLFEICAMGLPALSLANEVQEGNTIAYFEARGACINIGSHTSCSDNILHSKHMERALYSHSILNSLSRNAMRLVDANGLNRVVRIINQLITERIKNC